LPDNRIPNAYFESLVDTSDEWIVERTGIRSRNFASEDTAASDLAVEAATRALDAAGILAEHVDLIVCATLSGDTPIPSTAVWVQRKLGIPVVGIVDSNHSPEGIGYVIPGNDDSSKAVALYCRAVADAVLEGKANATNEVVQAVAAGEDEFVEVNEHA